MTVDAKASPINRLKHGGDASVLPARCPALQNLWDPSALPGLASDAADWQG